MISSVCRKPGPNTDCLRHAVKKRDGSKMPDGGKKAIIKKTDGNCTKVIALTRLTEKRMSEIRELEAVCRAYDRTEAEAELTNEMNYSRRLRCFFISYEHDRPAGFLSVFCPDGENAEIAAFVAPERDGAEFLKVCSKLRKKS